MWRAWGIREKSLSKNASLLLTIKVKNFLTVFQNFRKKRYVVILMIVSQIAPLSEMYRKYKLWWLQTPGKLELLFSGRIYVAIRPSLSITDVNKCRDLVFMLIMRTPSQGSGKVFAWGIYSDAWIHQPRHECVNWHACINFRKAIIFLHGNY